MNNGEHETTMPGGVPAQTVGWWNASFDIDAFCFVYMTYLHNGGLEGLATRRTLHDEQIEAVLAEVADPSNPLPQDSYYATGDTFPRWDWLVVSFAENGNATDVFLGLSEKVAAFVACFNAFDWTVPQEDDWDKGRLTDADIAIFNPNVDMVGYATDARGRNPENSALAFIQDIAMFPRSTYGDECDEIFIGADCFGSSFPHAAFRRGGTHGEMPVYEYIRDFCDADFYGKVDEFKTFIRYAARAAGALEAGFSLIQAIEGFVVAIEHSNIKHPEQIATAYQSTIEALGRFHIALQVRTQQPLVVAEPPKATGKQCQAVAPIAPAQQPIVIVEPPKATQGRKKKSGKPVKRKWHENPKAEKLLQIAACVYAPLKYGTPQGIPQSVIENLRAAMDRQSRRETMRAMYNSERVEFRKTMLGAKDYATVTAEEKEKCINSWAQHLTDYMHDNPPEIGICK